jgi:hypothetical protein
MSNGAMTLAEGSQKKDYRTDATMVLNGNTERGYVLRTAYDPLPVWKAKYGKGISPFYPRLKTGIKEAALIDDEIWVFGIDGTNVNDLISAVTIGTEFYKVSPQYILESIYIKNLNAEGERGMDLKACQPERSALPENRRCNSRYLQTFWRSPGRENLRLQRQRQSQDLQGAVA